MGEDGHSLRFNRSGSVGPFPGKSEQCQGFSRQPGNQLSKSVKTAQVQISSFTLPPAARGNLQQRRNADVTAPSWVFPAAQEISPAWRAFASHGLEPSSRGKQGDRAIGPDEMAVHRILSAAPLSRLVLAPLIPLPPLNLHSCLQYGFAEKFLPVRPNKCRQTWGGMAEHLWQNHADSSSLIFRSYRPLRIGHRAFDGTGRDANVGPKQALPWRIVRRGSSSMFSCRWVIGLHIIFVSKRERARVIAAGGVVDLNGSPSRRARPWFRMAAKAGDWSLVPRPLPSSSQTHIRLHRRDAAIVPF
ncbi:uncharacterized protein B0H64DRAFT_177935 [Chaetomium fimeti]|uniref:Uncharacterized protein n=1 Tax=Chaetomium fimeti TaxID=1854472 RepID=A0AAE0HCI6_9PEZI|nr:hypothetical protein B0H64DRAFT_177935 [Chaetomium fimeti]